MPNASLEGLKGRPKFVDGAFYTGFRLYCNQAFFLPHDQALSLCGAFFFFLKVFPFMDAFSIGERFSLEKGVSLGPLAFLSVLFTNDLVLEPALLLQANPALLYISVPAALNSLICGGRNLQ